MRLLVLAPAAIGPTEVREALGTEVEGAEVRVVAPALHEGPLSFWMSDADEAIAEAEEAERESVAALQDAGARASGQTGEGEPLLALQDALATWPAERVLVFVREEDERRYREDEVVEEAGRRFGVPVTLATLAR